MKIACILGTRPEIIKMAPVIRAAEALGVPFYVIHSNQHYSKEMDAIIFEDLKLKKPEYNLEVGSGTHGKQTGRILEKVEEILMKDRPDAVLVHGDVNTTLAGALAARKLLIPVGHVEAGLRSFDPRMPEEVNRTLVDHISDFCFTPTVEANNNLIKEGVLSEKIHVVGNSIVDACMQHKSLAENRTILKDLGLDNYFLVTMHRPETTDKEENLSSMVKILDDIAKQYETKIFFPMHPRTKKRLSEFNITLPESFVVSPPIGYLDFLHVILHAKLILTDSGGIQEEACILGKPCVTLRENTERPESVEVGANILGGITQSGIEKAVAKMIQVPGGWDNPFGDGKTGEKIIKTLLKKLK